MGTSIPCNLREIIDSVSLYKKTSREVIIVNRGNEGNLQVDISLKQSHNP